MSSFRALVHDFPWERVRDMGWRLPWKQAPPLGKDRLKTNQFRAKTRCGVASLSFSSRIGNSGNDGTPERIRE